MAKSLFVNPTDVDRIVKENDLQYLFLLGMRSNGKSSAVKALRLQKFLETGEKFAYIRRYSSVDMKAYRINSYFASVPGFDIKAISKGKYECIIAKDGQLWLSRYDEKGKIVRDVACGYYMALSEVEHMKSLNFPGVTSLIFEEVCTEQTYLDNEVGLLFSIVSTIFRNTRGIVYLISNTVSRVCPYFREFGLDQIYGAKVGDVQIYNYDVTNIGVWLTSEGVEDGEVIAKASDRMFFGSKAKMIKKGEWNQDDHRKLNDRYHMYRVLYTMVFELGPHKFLMQYMEHVNKHDNHIWFVQPKNSEIQPGTRTITDVNLEYDLATYGFIPLSDSERWMFSQIANKKVAFNDALTGTEFYQCYKQMMAVK